MSVLALAAAVLEGIAVLPAATLFPGPLSGQFIEAPPGIVTPFPGQPVQGLSEIAASPDGNWYALLDNGFGTRANSADFVLRIYSVTPHWRTAEGGVGDVRIDAYLELSDPQRRFPHTLIAELTHYPGSNRPVDPAIRSRRLLTGADLDPESLVHMSDGSFWVGDEFGPFLLHFSAAGELLEAPHAPGGVSAPEYASEGSPANLRASRGFEGLAVSPDTRHLYPMLEGSLPGQEGLLAIYTFDVEARAFTAGGADGWSWRYPLSSPGHAIGSFRLLDERRGLVLERDGLTGAHARFKKVFAVTLGVLDAEGLLVKTEIADLLCIDDPADLDGDGSTRFSFPHHTIESMAPVGDDHLLLVNDNNYPFGRARASDVPDATEFILLRIDGEPSPEAPRQP